MQEETTAAPVQPAPQNAAPPKDRATSHAAPALVAVRAICRGASRVRIHRAFVTFAMMVVAAIFASPVLALNFGGPAPEPICTVTERSSCYAPATFTGAEPAAQEFCRRYAEGHKYQNGYGGPVPCGSVGSNVLSCALANPAVTPGMAGAGAADVSVILTAQDTQPWVDVYQTYGGGYSGPRCGCSGGSVITEQAHCACPEGQFWHQGSGQCMTLRDKVLTRILPPESCATCSFKAFSVGDPIYPLTGAMKHRVNTGISISGLSLTLTYDTTSRLPASQADTQVSLLPLSGFGDLWESSFHHKLAVEPGKRTALVSLGDGFLRNFEGNGTGTFSSSDGNPNKLVTIAGGYRFTDVRSGTIETFDASGKLSGLASIDGSNLTFGYAADKLVSVTDASGRKIKFSYAADRVTQILGPDGTKVSAAYDAVGNLQSLTWADGRVLTFVYEVASLPWALTGIVDENSNRALTFGYDAEGRALSTERAGGVDRYELTYADPPQRMISEEVDLPNRIVWRVHTWSTMASPVQVAGPNGEQTSWTSSVVGGNPLAITRNQPAGSGSPAATSHITPDANGNVAIRDDFQGVRTCYAHDALRREVQRVEGLDTTADCASLLAGGSVPAGGRRLSTSWHPNWRLPLTIIGPLKKTTYVYNGQSDPFNGGAVANCTTAPSMPDGSPLPVACKQVEEAMLSSGSVDPSVAPRVRRFSYDAAGRLLSTTDANNRATVNTYYTTTAFTSSGSEPTDPWFDNVSLLLHADGTNGSTTFVDKSPAPKPLSAIGSGTTISTASSVFGGASVSMTGGGAVSGTSSDWGFSPSDDYTVEFWFKRTSGAGLTANMVGLGGFPRWAFFYRYTDRIAVYSEANGTFMEGVTPLSQNRWYHYALTKKGSTFRLFLNGSLEATATSGSGSASGSISMHIGDNNIGGQYFNGFIDDVRITKGVARYTASFTPPNGPYPDVKTNIDASSLGHTLGDLQSVADPAGHVTQFTQYDPAGHVRRMLDPKGITTDITYTPRGWVDSVTVTPSQGVARTTRYSHDPSGQLTDVSLPDGTSLRYQYDAAHRLTGITDARGNSVTYTLDASGNRTQEDFTDPSGALRRSVTRSFDALNRLQQVTGGMQ